MSALSASREATGIDGLDVPVRRRAMSMKRLGIYALLAAACIGAAWFGADWWKNGRFVQTTDDAYVGGDTTAISPHAAGFITDVLVTDNAHVAAGQLLIRLDARDYQAALDRARAALDARVAALASLHAQALLQQSMIRQAEADLQAKTARAAFTRIDGARYAILATTSAGSRQNAQRSHVADQEAAAATQAAEAALAASRQQLQVIDSHMVEAQASIDQARAEWRRASLDVGYTEIRSPMDGYVGNRAAHVGAFVAEGTYLLSIIPARGLWVDANFKEDQLAAMSPGQAATLTADAAPGRVFHGRVLSMAPGTGAVFSVIPPENATGNFTKIVQRVPVRIALDDAAATLSRLRPGISTVVSVNTKAAP